MKKKVLALIMCIVMVTGILPVCAFAEDGEFIIKTFKLPDGTEETYIMGYNGNENELYIPSEIDGQKIVFIDNNAFKGLACLESVVIDEKIEEIGEYAFKDCTNLKSVTIGKDTVVDMGVFENCSPELIIYTYFSSSAMKYAEQNGIACDYYNTLSHFFSYDLLDDGTIKITGTKCDIRAFHYLPSSIDGYNVSAIGTYAIHTNVGGVVDTFTIPEGVIELEPRAFLHCGLKTIILPDTVSKLHGESFYNCYKLNTIIIGEGNPYYKADDNIVYTKDGKTLVMILLPSNHISTTVIIPNTVEALGEYAFSGIDIANNKIFIPDSVKTVAPNAFTDCNANNTVYCSAGSPAGAAAEAAGLEVVYSYPLVNYPDLSIFSYEVMYDGTALITKISPTMPCNIEIPSEIDGYKVTYLGRGKKIINENVLSVTIPDSVVQINPRAFSDCQSLKRITLPESITQIRTITFLNCTSLEEIVIPQSVQSIAVRAFKGCTALKRIIFSDSPVTIGRSAFQECSSLEEVNISSSITWIGESAFYGCNSLKTVKIYADSIKIGKAAFTNCPSLESVVVYGQNGNFDETSFSKTEKPTFYGFLGSYTESYASQYNFPFIPLIPGDADVDGDVALSDMAVLKSYLCGNELDSESMQILDVNNDGAVDAFDLFQIDKTVNGI